MLFYICQQEEAWLDTLGQEWGLAIKNIPGKVDLEQALLRGGNLSLCTHLVVDSRAIQEDVMHAVQVLDSFFELYRVPVLFLQHNQKDAELVGEGNAQTVLQNHDWSAPAVHCIKVAGRETGEEALAVECMIAKCYIDYTIQEIKPDFLEDQDGAEKYHLPLQPDSELFTVVVAGLGSFVGTTGTTLSVVELLTSKRGSSCRMEVVPPHSQLGRMVAAANLPTWEPGMQLSSTQQNQPTAANNLKTLFPDDLLQSRVINCGSVINDNGDACWDYIPQGEVRLLCCSGALWDVNSSVEQLTKNLPPEDMILLIKYADEDQHSIITDLLRMIGCRNEIRFEIEQSAALSFQVDMNCGITHDAQDEGWE